MNTIYMSTHKYCQLDFHFKFSNTLCIACKFIHDFCTELHQFTHSRSHLASFEGVALEEKKMKNRTRRTTTVCFIILPTQKFKHLRLIHRPLGNACDFLIRMFVVYLSGTGIISIYTCTCFVWYARSVQQHVWEVDYTRYCLRRALNARILSAHLYLYGCYSVRSTR